MKKVGNRSLICRDARPAPWGREKVYPASKREASPRPVKITKTCGAKLISIHLNTEGNYKEGSKLSVDLRAFLPHLADFYPCPTRSQKGPTRASLLICHNMAWS